MTGSMFQMFVGSLCRRGGIRLFVAAAMVALLATTVCAGEMNWSCLRDGTAPGEPPARSGAVCWKLNDGTAYLFGAHESNDMWKYDPVGSQWSVVKPGQAVSYGTCGVPDPTNAPSARDGAVSWTGSEGALYLFGGYHYAASDYDYYYLNDLWRYDVATNQWTWLKGANTTNQVGIYGTQGEAAAGNTPGARGEAVSWTGSDGALYLIGGWGYAASGSGSLNDLWRYDVVTNQWTWLKGANTVDQVGVYGTQGVAALGNTPGARGEAVSWTGSDGALYLIGGWGYAASGSGSLNDLWRYDVVTNQWTWLKGANTTNQVGIYGTQGVAEPGNTPGARDSAVSWTGSDGALYLFGGYGYAAFRYGVGADYGSLNDLWRYDVVTNQWAWLKGANTTAGQPGVYGTQGVAAPGNTPGARDSAVSWTGSDGALYLFGGVGYAVSGDSADYLNDLWRYDMVTNQWTWLKGANTAGYQVGVYGTQGVAAPGNMPGARGGGVSWTGSDGALYLFGGYGYSASDYGDLNDLWRYDVVTNQWTWLKGANTTGQPGIYGTQGVAAPGNTPGARSSAISWTGSDGALYLFGGHGRADSASGSSHLNDLWRYDVVTNQWTWLKGANTIDQVGLYGTQGVTAAGNTPGARCSAVSWTGFDGALYLFGGHVYSVSGGDYYLNDLWRYDVAANQWTWLKGTNTTDDSGVYGTQGVAAAGNTPGAREGAISWTGSDGALYLFGGEGYSPSGGGRLNDLWRYNIVTNQWTWLKGANTGYQYGVYGTQGVAAADNTPGAREWAVSWTGSDGALYLFGGHGYAASGSGDLNDLWRYDVVTNQWTWLKGANTTNQVCVYDTQGVAAAGNTPGARLGAVSWASSDGALYLFGGNRYAASGSGDLNDLWRYDVVFGALTVTLQPAGAVSAGARWRRVGTTTWLVSGATETSVPAGQQNIEFKGVTGWTKPVNQSVTVPEDQTTTATGIYYASSLFTMVKDDPFDSGNLSTTGWTTFGASSAIANSNVIDHDASWGAYRIRTFSVAAGKWHNAGISNNRPDWIPYDSIGTNNYVRAKFYVYAQSDGSAGWSVNDIPSFAMRLTYRFAFWTQLYVNPHDTLGLASARDLRPSVDPAKPSIYRVDFDPIDVPYLSTYTQASGKEGIGAAFEVFETGNTARGYLCVTELVTGIYPTSALSGTPTQSKVYDGTRDAAAGDLHRFASTDTTFANLVPVAGGAADDGTTLDSTAGQLITYSESAQGFAMSSSAVPTTRYGSGEVTFHAGVNGAASNATRLRAREGEVYKARFHITSTQQTSAQASIWLNVKSVGTGYISYLQMQGGGNSSGMGALRQALPGVGNANRDRNTGDTTGGWYTVIMNSPLHKDIASDRTGTTIEQLMPNLALQPGPGVDAASRRDIKVGARMWDSLSSNGALNVKASEVGQFTIDRIEVTAYSQFAD